MSGTSAKSDSSNLPNHAARSIVKPGPRRHVNHHVAPDVPRVSDSGTKALLHSRWVRIALWTVGSFVALVQRGFNHEIASIRSNSVERMFSDFRLNPSDLAMSESGAVAVVAGVTGILSFTPGGCACFVHLLAEGFKPTRLVLAHLECRHEGRVRFPR